MQLMEASLLEEMEKTKVLEVDGLRRELAYKLNLVSVERPSKSLPKDSIDLAYLGNVVLLSPKPIVQEQLKLELDVLLDQRMHDKCLRNLSIKHEVQFKKVGVELDVKEIELRELE
jgi:hypothetical protein